MDVNKVKGMMVGVALGDALGVPFEFRCTNPKLEYDGFVNTVPFEVKFKYVTQHIDPASISDDTEFTIALFKACVGRDYDPDRAIESYIEISNRIHSIGRNTRRLFKGIKTIKGYKGRFARIDSDEKAAMQSNGSLMRCSPLAIQTGSKSIETDCYLTNPNETNLYCNLVYLEILRALLVGEDKSCAVSICKEFMKNDSIPIDVQIALRDALGSHDRCVSGRDKGWVCNTLYISIYSFLTYDTFADAMSFVIKDNPGSDTDTNAAVTGALFGVWMGFENMRADPVTAKNIGALGKITTEIDALVRYRI